METETETNSSFKWSSDFRPAVFKLNGKEVSQEIFWDGIFKKILSCGGNGN